MRAAFRMRLPVLLLWLAVPGAAAAAGAPTEAQVDAVARELRCVVCQNLSVADSPSEMARQMREVIRQRLAAGESPDAVLGYFVSRYGEWVLLSPPLRGFALLAWILPLGGLAVAVAVAVAVLRAWVRPGTAPEEAIAPEALAAVRQDMERRRL